MFPSPPEGCISATFSTTMSEAPPRASDVAAGLGALPGSVLDGGEIVLLAIKPSMWRPLLESASWMVTCCLLAAALTWLETPLPYLSLTATAQVILLVGLARVGLAVVRWVPTWYVLTNRRIIDIHGVRKPRISSCMLIHVRNTYVQCSPVESLMRLGTITLVTDSEGEPAHVWQFISRPDEVHAKIRRAIENAIDQQGFGL